MIKKILALVLSVTMLAGISASTVTNAAWIAKPETEPLISMDFEDGVVPKCHHTIGEFGFSDDAGVDNSKCIIIPGGWGTGSIDSTSFIFTAEAGKDYILSAHVKGGFYKFFYWTEPHVQAATEVIEDPTATILSEWKELTFHLNFPNDQTVGVGFQSGGSADLYIDQIAIYEAEEIPDPAPETTPTPPTTSTALTPIFEENFEGQDIPLWGDFELATDPSDGTNHVGSYNNTGWGWTTTDALISGVDANTVYTLALSVYGDISRIGVRHNEYYDNVSVSNGTVTNTDIVGITDTCVYTRPLDTEWNKWSTYIVTMTGHTQYKLHARPQGGGQGYYNGTLLIDDVKIYEGDVKAKLEAEMAEPTSEATATATATTTATTTTTAATATATTTATATITAEPSEKPAPPVVKVKFKKSKVTIKKGRKKVLKVTLKNAKKAKFSVNKKGKKVVKLTKKKAKKVTVKGKKKGKATITAKASGKKAKCKVTVK